MKDSVAVGGIGAMFIIWASLIGAWLTHVVVSIQYLINGMESIGYAALLGIGVLFPPVGAIHGIGVWFGAW